MGKFKDQHGKTRVGNFLKGLGNIADPILETVGDLTGIEALNKVSDLIVTDKELSNIQKQEALSHLRMDYEDISNARKLSSDIQKSQFSSWLAKNVPYIIDIFVLIIWGSITLFLVAKAMKWIEANSIDWTPLLGIHSGVTALATQIISFHRGSSSGSRLKDLVKN